MYELLIPNPDSIKEIVVEDLIDKEDGYLQGNYPKVLSPEKAKEFLRIINYSAHPIAPLHPLFKFTIHYQDGNTLEVLSEDELIQIGQKQYRMLPFVYSDSPLVPIANFHHHLDKKYLLFDLKQHKPTKYWLQHFVMINDGYIYNIEGLVKAEEAFDHFILNLIAEVDKGLDKETAYEHIKNLYLTFNELNDLRYVSIDTEDRERIVEYVMEAMKRLELFDEEKMEEVMRIRRW